MGFIKMNGVSVRGNGASYTSVEDTGVSVSSFREKREERARRDRERLQEKTKQERLAQEATQPVEFPATHALSVRGTVVSAAEPAPTLREVLGLDD